MRNTLIMIGVTLSIFTLLFIFRPKGIEGLRVPPVKVTALAFPYSELDQALKIALPDPQDHTIRYDLLRKSPEALHRYLGIISEIGPQNAPHRFMKRNERLAYLLNAYTAGLLALITESCPIKTLDEPYAFRGLFWRVSLRIGGEEVSLSDLQAQIKAFAQEDYRVMLALTYGDVSGVPIRRVAWDPNELEEGLSELESWSLKPPLVEFKDQTLWLAPLFQKLDDQLFISHSKHFKRHFPKLWSKVKRIEVKPHDPTLRGQCGL